MTMGGGISYGKLAEGVERRVFDEDGLLDGC